MKLKFVVTREELVAFTEQWLPLKLLLGDPANEERYLLLDKPRRIELEHGVGLRISCRAQILWPVLGMRVPVMARQLSVLLKPSVEGRAGQPALVFRPHIEQADMVGLPARLESTILDAVNRALSERVKPSWNFGSMLTRSIAMPELLATTQSIDLSVRYGAVEVTDDAFEFELLLAAATTRRPLKGA